MAAASYAVAVTGSAAQIDHRSIGHDRPGGELELEVTGMAAGGEGVGRDEDGRVVFVAGALPGERVRAAILDEHRSFARAVAVEVRTASADRRPPPCPHVGDGCGGCGWQHIEPAAQRRHRRSIVADALGRLGGISEPPVQDGPDLPTERYRTTVRATVVAGRAGFRRRRSHDALAVDDCLVAHPLLAELLVDGRFGEAKKVVLRAGARTGERLVVAHPRARGLQLPDGVRVVGADELARGRRAWFHEEVAGRRWRISASSFFQARPDGADALVAAVAHAVNTHAPDAATVVDLCAGVGLFAGAVGLGRTAGGGRRIVAVERDRAAVADARVNLAGDPARVVRSSFERWRPSAAEVVVADPPRAGLGSSGVATVAATGARLVVLVSCDPAALGRDASHLVTAGYELADATVIDLFPHTTHVETAATFVRRGR